MRAAVFLAVAVAVAVAAPLPAYLQTAGNPFKFNVTHDEVVGDVASASFGWSMYKQCDSAWANQQLGSCSLTICQAGCAMRYVTAVAML